MNSENHENLSITQKKTFTDFLKTFQFLKDDDDKSEIINQVLSITEW